MGTPTPQQDDTRHFGEFLATSLVGLGGENGLEVEGRTPEAGSVIRLSESAWAEFLDALDCPDSEAPATLRHREPGWAEPPA